jgi:undecaprenyl-diphosphatase
MARFGRTTFGRHDSFRESHPRTFNPDRLALTRGKGGVGIVTVCLAVFSILLVIVRRKRSQSLDAAITIKVQGQKSRWFDRLMHIVSWPGFPPQSRLLPPSISALLWLLGVRLEAVFQLLAWGTGGISFTVKRAMRRPRPEATAADTAIRVVAANIGGSSFPSGHVLNYLGVYGFLAYLAHTWIRPAAIRRGVVGVLLALLGLVGPSRIYLYRKVRIRLSHA